MKYIMLSVILLFSLNICSQILVTHEDLKTVVGNWEGSITYLDYQSNKPFTMAANLIIDLGKDEKSIVLNNLYPNEPKANNSEKIRVTKKERKLNSHIVTQREELENGRIHIQTQHKGKDDNKKALIRYTYEIGSDFFLIKKEVQFVALEDWIERSIMSYNQKD